jgi:IS5 family transposase
MKEKYEKVSKLKSKLDEMNALIDWTAFLKLYPEKEVTRGRPEYEKILMTKVLVLQSWHTISDEELEYQINDRLSFQKFLGFPKTIPDYSTIWRFREELTEDNIIEKVWDELKRQISEKNIIVREGKIQDATFIEAPPGKKNSGMEGRGRQAKTSRSKDGSWTKKSKKNFFGFKMHNKVDISTKLIEEVAVTTAKVHDGAIDLAKKDEVMYRDRGYCGINTKAKGNATMKRGKLNIKETLRNKRISKKRAVGEHPYGTIKNEFKGGTTRLTTIARVYVQQVFVCIAYNIRRLNFLLSDSSKKMA